MKKVMRLIEEPSRLSTSLIWDLQKKFYKKTKDSAWSQSLVPSYLTSQPLNASMAAKLCLAYLEDSLEKRGDLRLNPKEPVYFFDLGSGSGRFAYLFLEQIKQLKKRFPQNFHFRYIFCDLVKENLDKIQSHSYFTKYIEDGSIDFTQFDAEKAPHFYLELSQRELKAEDISNPSLFLANYFFNSIQNDLFKVEDGKVLEGLISLSMPEEQLNEQEDFSLEKLRYEINYQAVEELSKYYPNFPLVNRILKDCCQKKLTQSFSFPIGAFKLIQNLRLFFKERFFLYSSDQNFSEGQQDISWHSSFSIPVNYLALQEYFLSNSGYTFLPALSSGRFLQAASVLGGRKDDYPKLEAAFKENIEETAVLDYWELGNIVLEKQSSCSLKQILHFLKIGKWDPVNFSEVFRSIKLAIPQAKAEEKAFLKLAIQESSKNFFPLHPNDWQFFLQLGMLQVDVEDFEGALQQFMKAIQMGASDKILLANMGYCYAALKKEDDAAYCFLEAEML